ncbi:DNA cytosine methyltransferase [Alteromonas marina]|jgi:DNA (cytosine-5)-methyltransferase 1|nr:DNA (cytosine-5-)-methyltransferase [Alteromonas marina]
MMANTNYSLASVFSGAGGLDYGFHKAGFEHILANDKNIDACETFKKNISDIELGPLSSIQKKLEALDGLDLFIGGPPCQGFSVGGKMDPDDSRSKLSFEFMNILNVIRPKVFVFENVKALARNKRWSNVFQELKNRAHNSGYELFCEVLKVREFGVAQLRERLFIVGFNKERIANAYDARLAFEESLYNFKNKAEPANKILSKLGQAGTNKNPITCSAKIIFAKKPVLRNSPFSGMLFNGSGRPVNPSYFFPTLAASMGGNRTPIIDEANLFMAEGCFVSKYFNRLKSGGTPYVGEAPSRLRRMTVNECKLAQTFPEDFILTGTSISQYTQIGNSVPPKMSEALALSIKHVLDSL